MSDNCKISGARTKEGAVASHVASSRLFTQHGGLEFGTTEGKSHIE